MLSSPHSASKNALYVDIAAIEGHLHLLVQLIGVAFLTIGALQHKVLTLGSGRHHHQAVGVSVRKLELHTVGTGDGGRATVAVPTFRFRSIHRPMSIESQRDAVDLSGNGIGQVTINQGIGIERPIVTEVDNELLVDIERAGRGELSTHSAP